MSASRRFVVLAGTLSLAGCMVGPDYKRPLPATAPTAEFKETSDSVFRPALPRDTIDRGPWWSVYGDPTLDGFMAQVDVSNQTLKQNEAAYRQAVALYRQTVLTAFQQVEDGLVQQRLVEQQEKVQQGAVAAAREAERLSLNQYRAGTVPYTTVIQTQTSALSAEQTLINVRLTRFNTSATLVTALGGGWRVQDLPVPAATRSSDPAPAPAAAVPKKQNWWPF